MNNTLVIALVDSGCTRSIISRELVARTNERHRSDSERIVMMNGTTVNCDRVADVCIELDGVRWKQACLTCDILPGYKMLLGMDVINRMGGVRISDGEVRFSPAGRASGVSTTTACAASDLRIEDCDFSATFEDGKWVVKWKWNEKVDCCSKTDRVLACPVLQNRISHYPPSESVREDFEHEVESWVENGWLRPYDGPFDGVVPLMAVVQRNKKKVRPVLDYREVNSFLSCHTAESAACNESLRTWRRLGTNVSIIDLRNAYLQLHVHPDLWKYQVVRYKGQTYCMTRLGFGLSIAPKVMTSVLKRILGMNETVAAATESYIDDIAVNNDIVSNETVLQQLRDFGLEAKDPVPLDGARVLGLKVTHSKNGCRWSRDNPIVDIKPSMTRREIFSWCGQLVGHLPVANWLRPACSFLKRISSETSWDEPVSEKAMRIIEEIDRRCKASDPACGRWDVPRSTHGVLWCDASSLAIGACLEVGGHVIEDACWLRKKNDASHINLAELEAVLKGLSIALAWDLKNLELKTDSMSVYAWIRSLLSGDKRIRTKGMSEALVHRRLFLLNETLSEYGVRLTVSLVPSQNNRADLLTRVPQTWLKETACAVASQDMGVTREAIRNIHSQHHFGVDRTFFFVQQKFPESKLCREAVEKVIRSCVKCKSIDPAAEKWEHGVLHVEDNWVRLACDVTHFCGERFLTVIDSGPSRFMIWRRLRSEAAGEVSDNLEQIFREHGIPSEVLCDNGPCFRSQTFTTMLRKWNVKPIFRCAYRASGNGLAERSHRTIKRMAARSGGDILDMVRFYNAAPLSGTDEETCPCRQKFSYRWSFPADGADRPPSFASKYRVGQRVFVKPPNVRCTSRWKSGTVTGLPSERSVEVGGIPRHLGDVRAVPESDSADSDSTLPMEESYDGGMTPRIRRMPQRFDDYVLDLSDPEIMEECSS